MTAGGGDHQVVDLVQWRAVRHAQAGQDMAAAAEALRARERDGARDWAGDPALAVVELSRALAYLRGVSRAAGLHPQHVGLAALRDLVDELLRRLVDRTS